MRIEVKKISKEEMDNLGINRWPIWEKEKSSFDWFYDEKENCYFLEGEAEVETSDGKRTVIKKGDFVSFPKGLKCKWHVREKVKKHYNFE